MATDSEIIGAFAANAADIMRLEAALAAKDAEIERLREAMLAEHQRAEAAEAEVASKAAELRSLTGYDSIAMAFRNGVVTERERCARIAITTAEGHLLGGDIAAAIRAG